jgi:hypothetical protein
VIKALLKTFLPLSKSAFANSTNESRDNAKAPVGTLLESVRLQLGLHLPLFVSSNGSSGHDKVVNWLHSLTTFRTNKM